MTDECRIQNAECRTLAPGSDGEHAMTACKISAPRIHFCILHSAFCVLHSAFCILFAASGLLTQDNRYTWIRRGAPND